MLRSALGLTSILLLTACAGNNAQMNASSKEVGFTNAKMQTASSSGSDINNSKISIYIPTPKFKPVWMTLANLPVEPEKPNHDKSIILASAGKISDHELDKNRGTFAPEVLNSTVLEATATQNVAINSVTGDNIVSSSAFSNAQGLVNLIQNSGNNVVIQSSTVVNLTFQ
jgi:hypothetical protein